MKKSTILFVLILLFGLILTACELGAQPQAEPTQPPPPTEPPPTEPPPTEPPPSDTPEPTPEPPTATPEPTAEPALEPLPAEPIDMEFTAEDGQVLPGRYYPAAVNPAPVIVLHHWAGGDLNDWNEIAFWLQNRGLIGTSPNFGEAPWLDSTWFPPMFEGQSVAVFTFSFRGCSDGCSSFSPGGWLMDAQAAMKTASELEGVDPTRIAAMGASIGADGAPDGCFWLNDQAPDTCLGALSLSPGSYLGVTYSDAVAQMEEDEKPVWCFYATGDAESAPACQSASGVLYQLFEWAGNLHGMMLLQPDVDPSAMELILDFIAMVFGF